MFARTITNDAQEYAELCDRVAAAENPPEGLRFWLRHSPQPSAQMVWRDCPRADWLLWLAELYGMSGLKLERVRTAVKQNIDLRRAYAIERASHDKGRDPGVFTPTCDAADQTRSFLHWGELAELAEPRRQRAA